MPARVVSSAGTSRGATVIPKRTAAVPSQRPVKSGKDDTKAKPTAPVADKHRREDGADGKGELVLSAIKSPKSCSRATVDKLAALLCTSISDLEIFNTSAASSSKVKLNGKQSSASLGQESKISNGTSTTASAFPALPEAKRVHLAKLVVNAVIASLNDLIGAGWKNDISGEKATEGPSSRSTSASSTSASSSALRKAIKSTHQSAASTPVTESNIACVFDCARVAVHFLILEERKAVKPQNKELELEFILSSIVRKILALDLHHLAAIELDWLRGGILQRYTDTRAGRSFEYTIPNTIISTRLRDLILEVQALSLTCALFQAASTEITELLSAVTRQPGGPLSWQQFTRSTLIEEAKESADRHAYSVERSVTKYLAKYAKVPKGIDAEVVLQCRKTSLDFLLFVSDLDQDAFWDRTARVASSYIRSKTASESTSAQEKRAAFLLVDDVLRDVVRRAEQVQSDFITSATAHKLQGKGFNSFCEVWIQLAQRAGEAQAIHHIAGLLAGNDQALQGVQLLSDEQVNSLVTQLCARLSQLVVAVGGMLEGDIDAGAFKTAEVEVDAGLRLAGLVSSNGLQKIFNVLDQLRRRLMRLLDDKKVRVENVTTLLLAICKHYEQYLESDGKAQLEDDEAILEDCIYVLRSLANSTFVVADWTTHEAAAAFLGKCETLLTLRQGKMKSISDAVRCNKMRLLSSSWYYIGGQLYNDKELPLAIRFLKVACDTAQIALDMYDSLSDRTISKGELVKRPEGTAKKWEHLAVSYRHTGQFRLSHEAFIGALKCTEEKTWKRIAESASRRAISEVFSTPKEEDSSFEKTISDVASVAKSCFEVAAFDLLLYHNKSENDWIQHLTQSGIAKENVAAPIEHCLSSLDNTMHREEAPQAALHLVDQLLSLYDASKTPVRRARVLLRRVELVIMQAQILTQTVTEDDDLACAKEIEDSLSRKEMADDVELARYIPQYLAMLSLLRILHGSESVTPRLASEASARLTKLIASIPAPPNRALKTSSAPKQQSNDALPTTPPRGKGGKRTTKGSVKTNEAIDSAPVIEDANRLCSFIELAVEVMNSRGFPFAAMELLSVNKQLAEALQDRLGPNHLIQYRACLVRQHLSLGMTVKAGILVEEMEEAVKKEDRINPDTRVRCSLASAEYYCQNGKVDKSEECYHDAVRIASGIKAEGRMSSIQSGLHRCHTHERHALAAEMISNISLAKGDLVFAIKYAILGVRSAMKAGLVLSRMTASSDAKDQDVSPFVQIEAEKEQADGGEASVVKVNSPPRLNSPSVAILYWRMVRTLYSAYSRVADLYILRGSARDAEGFMGEAVDFISSVSLPRLLASALINRGSLRSRMGNTEKGRMDRNQAATLIVNDKHSLEALQMVIAKAEEDCRATSLQTALNHYEDASSILDALTVQYIAFGKESKPQAAKKGSISKSKDRAETLLPDLRGKLLREKARLLVLLGREEEGREALDEAAVFIKKGPGRDILACSQAMIQVHQSMRVLKADPVMGMLPESAISMPMIKLASKEHGIGTIIKAAISRLGLAQNLLEGVIADGRRSCMDASSLRNACISSVTSQMLLHVLQGSKGTAPEEVVVLHQGTSALTLQREMQDAVEVKLENKRAAMSLPGWQLSSKELGAQYKDSSPELTSEDEAQDDASSTSRWSRIGRRHRDLAKKVDLPEHWTVISITLHRERNCLVLTRMCGAKASSPIAFSLPIDRQSRREGEEETISVDVVLQELRSIIEQSNTATHSAQHLEGMQARKDWWTTRRELDNRLKELLASIEVTWLGAFKSLLLPRPNASVEDVTSLRVSFDAVFQRAFFSSSAGGKKASQVGLDDGIFACFSALSATSCTDEELEDLIHFVMDAYQFHGISVAVDEVDMALCVTELRGVLESFKAKCPVEEANDDRHVFLILDKDTCAIPWESIPLLRKQAVCRIPSLAFLEDRLEANREQGTPGRFCIRSERAKVWYLLNPSKDLIRTQDRFLPWLEKQQPIWTGIVNRAPIIEEMAEALESKDIVLYFGHGGGEQYVRPSRLRGLKKCAVTMLWGCSSGVLKDLGEFDRSGTPYNYLMAGCPSLLGNLWDATDKELDGISESVLEKMGLKVGKDGTSPRLSIAQAVAQSRDACKLPYLTGAACVVYGVPVYYQ